MMALKAPIKTLSTQMGVFDGAQWVFLTLIYLMGALKIRWALLARITGVHLMGPFMY